MGSTSWRTASATRALAWTAAGLCTACSVTGVIFELITRATPVPTDFGSRDSTTASAVVFMVLPVMGALIATRRPENPIGWLFISVGATMAVWVLADGTAVYTLRTEPGAFAGGRWLAWIADWLPVTGWGLVGFVLLLFPTGRLPSPRWRPAVWGVLGATGAFAGALAVGDDRLVNYTYVHNPVSLVAVGASPGTVKLIGTLAMVAAGIPVLISLVGRRRHASGDERQQVKWLTWASLVTVSIILVFALLMAVGARITWAEDWVLLVGILIPVAAGIAVLKYRLYGIDLVINKTVVFGILAAFITTVYTAVVVGVGDVVGAPRQRNLALSVIATSVVAVTFEPVRARAQRFANRVVYGERATPYEILSAFSERMSGAFAADAVLPRMAEVIAEGVGAREASVWLHYDDELHPAARWPEGGTDADPPPLPMSGEVLPTLPGGQRAFPVRHQGELLGAIAVAVSPGDRLDPAREKILADLALQAALVLRNVRLIAELRASRQRIVAAGDAERRRLERDIHDGAQQQLVALAVKLRLAEDVVGNDPDTARTLLNELRAEALDALGTMRDLARGIYPPLLADEGLVRALKAQAAKTAMVTEVEDLGVSRYQQDVEAAVYFSCLEALQNVAKYAEASAVVIRLEGSPDELRFEVTDDGRGFDPSTASGSGLRNIADRLAALDGTLDVRSTPGGGTTVSGRLPVGPLTEPSGATAPEWKTSGVHEVPTPHPVG